MLAARLGLRLPNCIDPCSQAKPIRPGKGKRRSQRWDPSPLPAWMSARPRHLQMCWQAVRSPIADQVPFNQGVFQTIQLGSYRDRKRLIRRYMGAEAACRSDAREPDTED